MISSRHLSAIVTELKGVVAGISAAEVAGLLAALLAAKRLFVAGVGRSGHIVKAFAVRWMHLGFSVFVVGDAVTPAIEAGDFLLVGSGSGETTSLVVMVGKAKQIGTKVGLITASPGSSLALAADLQVRIPPPTSSKKTKEPGVSIQPGASLFEQALLVTLDGLVLAAMEHKGMDRSIVADRHANLE